MEISIEYRTQLKAAAGVASERLELDGAVTAETAIRTAAQRRGDNFSQMLFQDGALKRHILICVDDEQVSPAQVLAHDCHMILFPPISGG